MSSEIIIGKRYARAVFEIAQTSDTIDQTGTELEQISNLIHSNPELRSLIENPVIDVDVKKNALKQSLQQQVSTVTLNTLQLMIDRGREKYLPAVVKAYRQLSYEYTGKAIALVYSPYPLSDSEKSTIAAQFGRVTKKTIEIKNEVDPKLLGGLKVQIGDTIYDGSLATKLETMEKHLIEAKAI